MELQTFKTPDLSKPRHREKAVNFLAYPDKDPYGFFAQMKEQYPDLAQFPNKEIAGWLKRYLKELANQVLTDRRGVELPGNLGAVMVGLSKPATGTKTFNIDFKTSRQLGHRVHHHNMHTDGLLAKIYYYSNIPRRRLKWHYLLRFKPCRNLSRSVARLMREEGKYKRYMVFSSYFRVSNLFRNRKIRNQRHPTTQDLAANYDPLAFD